LRVTRAVIDRLSLLDQISAVRNPTLILVGAEDQTQPWEEAEKIRARLMGAKLVTVPEAGQISSVEQPEFVTRQIAQFMEELNIH
jgi:pimeloyl-ACP methyl ester carboxylesterase